MPVRELAAGESSFSATSQLHPQWLCGPRLGWYIGVRNKQRFGDHKHN